MVFEDIAISVIVPVYNVQEYLSDCLNSLIFQTLENIEIICIDDKSTDNSYDMLKYYSQKDNRIKVFQNKCNIGLGASRNVGLSKASGKYIYFLDSDDWLDRDTLKECYDNAEKYDLDIIMFKLINFDDDEKKFYKTRYYSINFMDKYLNKPLYPEELSGNQIFRLPNSACNKLFLKSFLTENNILFPEGLIHEDNPFYFKTVLNSKKFMILDKYFLNRRIRHNSITQKNDKSVMDVMEITELVLDFFIESCFYDRYKKNVLNYTIRLLKNKYYLIDDKLKPEYYDKLKKIMKKYLNSYNLENDFLDNLYDLEIRFFKLLLISDDYNQLNENILKLKERKNKYKVSVITPIYNAKRVEINKAFNSIRSQSLKFEDIEVIFIDDNSSFREGTMFIQELNDLYPNVKSYFLNENKGSGNARNIGIKNSTSDYIMFLDHDDIYLKNACKILFNTINKSDVDMVCGNYINMVRGNKPIYWGSINNNEHETKVKNVFENPKIFRIDPSIWSKIYKKDFLIRTDTFFKDFKSGQDLIFFQETLFKANGIILINEPIVRYSYRQSDDNELQSISLNNSKKILKVLIDVYEYSYNLFKRYDKSLVDYPLNSLNYWINSRLLNSNLDYEDFIEVVEKSNNLFRIYYGRNKNKAINNKKLVELISKERYDEAYDMYSSITNRQ